MTLPWREPDLLRYTNAETVTQFSCTTFVTDNETDEVSPGQGKLLFDHLTCPKEFRLFTKAEGAEGHCERNGSCRFLGRSVQLAGVGMALTTAFALGDGVLRTRLRSGAAAW